MKPPRVVLDTNVFISALLFGGECSRLVPLWQKRRFLYLLSRPILEEYVRTLAYPKFKLTEKEIKALIEEDLLPFVETIPDKKASILRLKDQDDEKFLIAVVNGNADCLVTGDHELLGIETFRGIKIIQPSEFLKEIK